MMTRSSAPGSCADHTLDDNLAAFDDLLDRAERLALRGPVERAAVAARVAATFAWFNHTGTFASRRLELLLADLGDRIEEDPVPRPVAGRIVHVATELYGTGGHTQMLAGWLSADSDHEHLVCLTGQRGRRVPDKLLEALLGPEGIVELDADHDTLTARAAALRRVAATAEFVVLHVHPDDVVPGLAFSSAHRPGAPVCLVNHADHVFWTGTGSADLVLDMRNSGAELTAQRRGVPPGRQQVLTRPLRVPGVRQRDPAARAALGVPPGRLVVATAAAASKYDPVDETGFLDVLGPLLTARDDVFLLAAGPDSQGRWAGLEANGHGRALGLLPQIDPLLEAADVYVDSYPFSSLTSMLEAAAVGVPVLTLREPTHEPAVLGADTPELDDTLVVAHSADALRDELARLLDDAGARTRLGRDTRAGVEAAHANAAWLCSVHRALSSAGDLAGRGRPVPGVAPRRCGDLDHRVAGLQAQTGWGQGRRGALTLNAGLLPWYTRLGLVVADRGAWRRPGLRALLSNRAARRLRSLRG